MAWHTLLARGERLHVAEHALELRQYIGSTRVMVVLDGALHTLKLPCDVELDGISTTMTLDTDGKGKNISVVVLAPREVKIDKVQA